LVLSGSFAYDEPCAFGLDVNPPQWCFDLASPSVFLPVLSFTMNLGPYHWDLRHVMPDAYVQGPSFHHTWGPAIDIAPQFLPAGIASLGLFNDGLIIFNYSTTAGAVYSYDFINMHASPISVPAPPTWVVLLGSLAGFALKRRAK
jgi:hypothetical protein